MRIGIDISQIVYQTGVSRYTAELVDNLLRLDQINHYVLFAGSLRQRLIIKSFVANLPRKVSLVLTPFSPRLADLAFNRLNFPMNRFIGNVDIFHSSNWTIPNLNCPIITTIHDLTFLKSPQDHLSSLVAVHKRQLKRTKKMAAAVIAVSQSTKRDLLDFGFATDKVKVIYEAASSLFRPVTPMPVKKKYQLVRPYILSVGTLEPRKNLNRLIEAYQQLNLGFDLVIVGKFGWGERVKPVTGVRLLGFVPDEDLAGLYSGAQVFVYPSLEEGFGLPVLEAMACGCPVVTSGVSSLPEIGGQAAVYVEPASVKNIGEGIKTALGKQGAMRSLGLVQARRFSWVKTAKETLKIYREVYANRY